LVAHRWLTTIFERVVQMVPPPTKSPVEAAEVFHEILEHRWYLSEQAGHEIEIFDTARDYVRRQLNSEPLEATLAT
jgi:Domain of unknown function (DUF4032)